MRFIGSGEFTINLITNIDFNLEEENDFELIITRKDIVSILFSLDHEVKAEEIHFITIL